MRVRLGRPIGYAALCALVLAASPVQAQKGVPPTVVFVGGYGMVSDRDLVENLSQSNDTRVFMDLLHSSGLIDSLRQKGPFTVFVPTDEAFSKLPAGMIDSLRRPENKPKLFALLSEHVVPEIYSSSRLRLLLRGKGQVELDTLNGGKLGIGMNGPSNLVLRNASGVAASITLYDVKQANGVIFIIDRVVLPG